MGIYFIRHGQTQNNLEGKMNPGDDDDVLTDVGKIQAQEAGKKIKATGLSFDYIICSSLSRVRETAEIIAKEIEYTGLIGIDARLREQDAGVFVGRKRDDIKKEFGLNSDDEFRRIFKDKKYNKVEDIHEFDTRVKEVYEETLKNHGGKNILFVAHSGTSRGLLKVAQDLDFEYAYFQLPGVKNCELIDLENYKSEVQEDRKNIK